MDKQYNHNQNEKEIYKQWEESGAFTPPAGEEVKKGKKPFTIIMPPPNANDPLHMGHAMFVAIEDILIRYHRMKGEDTLWLPGTDHAGIETQFVFEKRLSKEGKSRFDFDRKTLYKMIDEYVKENSGVAIEQMKRLGASADWSRYKFTLDKDVVEFVLNTFMRMQTEGLIYRAERPVNYCTKCGTSYSELEVNYQDEVGKLYYVKYPLVENENESVVVATTRPETMFADVAIAVHPDDKKWKKFVGKKVKIPLKENCEIEIIESRHVDMELGTGALKVTPAHDRIDWMIREESLPEGEKMRYDRDYPLGINTHGKMTDLAPKEIAGLNVNQARDKTIQMLEKDGFFEKPAEDHPHRVGHCYKCNRAIEILPLPQFFVEVESLVKPVLKLLKSKEVQVYGAGQEKILKNWLENLKDWNVSRQIVWGIRMPVWYNVDDHRQRVSVGFIDKERGHTGTLGQFIGDKDAEETAKYTFEEVKKGLQQLEVPMYIEEGDNIPFVVSKTEPEEEGLWLQETSTFDTWFSSSQWPVVTLKTGKENDFEKYYPTQVMETAYDILMFWVMRMMMMGIYLDEKDRPPFTKIYLHGLIRDGKGQKMSKSKGNAINPVEMVEKYGSGAVRMALVMSSTPGQDKNVGEDQVRGMRNFANKIWNAARFVKDFTGEAPKDMAMELWYTKTLPSKMSSLLDQLRIGQAAEYIYTEFWHKFCDLNIEEAKKGKINAEQLREGLIVLLKLSHPFMPFVTERVWQELGQESLLIEAEWPKS